MVCGAGLQVGVRRRGRLLRGPGAAHLRRGDGALVGPADELASVVPGPLPADVQLRRPLAGEAGPGGVRLPHRDGLLRHPPGAGDGPRVRRHPGVLSGRGQVPPGRPPQLQRPAGAGRDPQTRRPLPGMRQTLDRGGHAPGRGPGRPGAGCRAARHRGRHPGADPAAGDPGRDSPGGTQEQTGGAGLRRAAGAAGTGAPTPQHPPAGGHRTGGAFAGGRSLGAAAPPGGVSGGRLRRRVRDHSPVPGRRAGAARPRGIAIRGGAVGAGPGGRGSRDSLTGAA